VAVGRGPVELIDLGPGQLPGMAELERLCFPEEPWPVEALAGSLQGRGVVALGLAGPTGLAACALGRVAADEAELHSLSVHPGLRRQGLGRLLLEAFLEAAGSRGARSVWLEVREANAAAIALYLASGFLPAGRRRRYYDNGEDALVLRLDLAAPPPSAG